MITAPNQAVGDLFNAARSTMYIFAPSGGTFLPDVHHRPLLYQMDENFAVHATEAVHRSYASNSEAHLKTLATSPIVHGAALPSLRSDAQINLKQLEYYWRFVLVLENPQAQGVASPTSSLTKTRVIVMGYFNDEPIAPTTLYNPNPAVNTNAMLTITHKTVVDTLSAIGANGMTLPRISMRSDQQIISPHMQMMSSDSNLCRIDPKSCQRAVSYTPEGASLAFPPEITNGLASMAGPEAMNTKMAIPEYNLYHILKGVVSTYRDSIADETNGPVSGDYPAFSVTADSFNHHLLNNLGSEAHPASIAGPRENEVMTLGMLFERWPGIEVVPLTPESSSMYASLDQQAPTPVNVFSDLLCTTIPSVMATYSIASLAFRYTSNTGAISLLGENDKLDVSRASTFVIMPDELVRGRVDSVIDDLKRGVFAIMKAAHGDFYVDVSVNAAGMAQIQLSFLDDNNVTMSPFERPVCYDGLMTSLVGTREASIHNTSQLGGLIGAISSDLNLGLPAGPQAVRNPQPSFTTGPTHQPQHSPQFHGGPISLSGHAPTSPGMQQPQQQPAAPVERLPGIERLF